MVSSHVQSREDLDRHLAEQLGFLKASAEAFDSGSESEAKRLAVALRVLLHQTDKSHSLLGQLGKLHRDFCDLSFPITESGNLLPSFGLVVLVQSLDKGSTAPARYMAPLDEPELRVLPFSTWWSIPVFRHPNTSILTRKQIVLGLANQDGGAHVDPELDPPYARLSRGNAMGMHCDLHLRNPIGGVVHAAVRQIAHETIRTLDVSYRKKQTYPHQSVMMGPISLTFEPFRPGEPRPPAPVTRPSPPAVTGREISIGAVEIDPRLLVKGPAVTPKVGRNDPCPCGSGKKAKRCHPEWT